MRLSASQFEKFTLCQRAWGFRYLDGIREPQTSNAAALGTRVHEILEQFLTDGTRPDLAETMSIETRKGPIDYWPGQIALSGIHLLPKPGTVDLESEVQFTTPSGVSWIGRIDGTYQGPHGLVILDHKTTSDRKWTKDLEHDVQANLYAYAKLGDADSVTCRWVYYLTAGSRRESWVVERRMPREEVEQKISQIDAIAITIDNLYKIRPKASELPPTPSACGAFGGCYYRDRCDVSAIDVLFTEERTVELDEFIAQKTSERAVVATIPPLPGAKPWAPGDPLSPTQEAVLASGASWAAVALSAKPSVPPEVAGTYDAKFLPGLPLRPRVNTVINPPEAPPIPVAEPSEMPPADPVEPVNDKLEALVAKLSPKPKGKKAKQKQELTVYHRAKPRGEFVTLEQILLECLESWIEEHQPSAIVVTQVYTDEITKKLESLATHVVEGL